MLGTIAQVMGIIGGVLGSIGFFLAGNDWMGGIGLVIAAFNLFRLLS
ncbi:MAG: hypothetical protein FWE40_07265 [Oscillospiraceae bacterium]|jgi:hypothetical protein|nr:hypothetical protein [Oscillospiraceae bacterium]